MADIPLDVGPDWRLYSERDPRHWLDVVDALDNIYLTREEEDSHALALLEAVFVLITSDDDDPELLHLLLRGVKDALAAFESAIWRLALLEAEGGGDD